MTVDEMRRAIKESKQIEYKKKTELEPLMKYILLFCITMGAFIGIFTSIKTFGFASSLPSESLIMTIGSMILAGMTSLFAAGICMAVLFLIALLLLGYFCSNNILSNDDYKRVTVDQLRLMNNVIGSRYEVTMRVDKIDSENKYVALRNEAKTFYMVMKTSENMEKDKDATVRCCITGIFEYGLLGVIESVNRDGI